MVKKGKFKLSVFLLHEVSESVHNVSLFTYDLFQQYIAPVIDMRQSV